MRTLDAVAAYDRIAPVYASLAQRRRAYLEAVDRLVVAGVPPGSCSLLDVGAGDGVRARRIAAAAGLSRVVLVEPSAAMRSRCPAGAQIWDMRAEDLRLGEGSFDVITCLWNVPGHIFPAPARLEALRQFARLCAPDGRIFVDVNHRYNARHYGLLPTVLRFLRDRLRLDPPGDVTVSWMVEGRRVAAPGHVFTGREFETLVHAAGLRIEQRFVLDYTTGELCRLRFAGQLFYVLRTSPI